MKIIEEINSFKICNFIYKTNIYCKQDIATDKNISPCSEKEIYYFLGH